MPCDSIITNTVDLPKMHPKLRAAALKGLKVTDIEDDEFSYQGNRYALRGGVLVGLDGQSQREVGRVADLLKQQYSTAVVKTTAARNGWALKQIGPNRYAAVKR